MQEQHHQRLDDILQSLRSRPTLETLASALDYLDRAPDGFNIREPGPKASLLISTLVDQILCDFWSSLKPSESQETDNALFLADTRLHFLNCLRGANGLGALEARLRMLMLSQRGLPHKPNEQLTAPVIDLLEVLAELLHGDTFLWSTWSSIRRTTPASRTAYLQLRGLLGLLCGGRLHSTAAEADSPRIRVDGRDEPLFWISDRSQYWRWVGRNIVHMAMVLESPDTEGWQAVARVLGKSLRFGYQSHVVEEVYLGLIVQTCHLEKLHQIVRYAPVSQKRQFLDNVLHILRQKLSPQSRSDYTDVPRTARDSSLIAAAAAAVSGTVGKCEHLKEGLVNWLLAQVRGFGPGSPLLEAAVAVLAPDEECVRSLLEKSVQQFGDNMFINRAPMSSQKVNVQILLLLAGCLHRSNEQALRSIAGSSIYLNAISNRLAGSGPRCRFLGMVVGSAVSALVDSSDKRLTFDLDDSEIITVRWYKSLTRAPLILGSLDDMRALSAPRSPPQTHQPRQHHQPTKRPTKRPETAKRDQPSKGPLIEDVTDVDAYLNGLFMPHDKPDSDKEDSDEDPTLVDRQRPSAPVYIRELLKGLRDSEDYGRQQLALSAAAGLIRRKAEYGTEVSDHAEELAAILTGLQDKFDMENFQEQRSRAMVALVDALPTSMGPWFINAFFTGDYSVSQRLSILSAIGLGARRVAGFQAEDEAITGTEAGAADAFPSKKLPEILHKIYSDQASPTQLLAQRLGRTMALAGPVEADDSPVGPNALKIQKGSTRMSIEKKRKPPVKNALAGIVGGAFFYPLVGGWWVQMKALGTNGFFMSTDILPAYLKTVSIILHASGPATASLPDLTSEFWDLLMSTPSNPSYDSSVIEGLLFGFLTILDINEDHRRLVEEQSREVIETQKWASKIFDDAAGGDAEDDRIKMLAASILVKISDMTDKYQALLLGNLT